MTKRYGNFEDVKTKKPKLDNNVDDLWGDELDDDAFDDCVRIATQVEEKITLSQDHNISLLPTYNLFKHPNNLISSTQLNTSLHIATSSKLNGKIHGIDEDKLRSQLDEKIGEVSILRNQLQDVKSKHQVEKEKHQLEWLDKINLKQKEIQALKSELDFKNLEIGNLKQKVLNVSKHNFETACTPSVSKVQSDRIPKYVDNTDLLNDQTFRKEPILNSNFPLSHLNLNIIFNSALKEHLEIKLKYNKQCCNTIPYLQNQAFQEHSLVLEKSKPAKLCTNEDFNTITCIYSEITSLIQCRNEDIDNEENYPKLNKIIYVSIHFLLELKSHLEAYKSNMKIEDIQQADSNYLEDEFTNFDDYNLFEKDKLGIKAGQTIFILAHLLPYSTYFSNYLVHGKTLIFKENENYRTNSFINKKNKLGDHYYLDLLLNIVDIIGKIRKARDMTGLLYSIVILLINICKSKHFDHVWYNVCKITKEILFARPAAVVVCKLTYLLKHASHYTNFVDFMFKKSNCSYKINTKKGLLYFNPDSCRFYVFAILFVDTIFKKCRVKVPLKVCINMLSFIYNTFKWSNGVHHRDTKQCDCLAQLYKLEIELVFKILMIFNEENKQKKMMSNEWISFFRHEVTIKVLNLMTFNSYELTEKYVSVYSQYKEIQRNLPEESIEAIEGLVITEEIPNIPNNNNGFSQL